VCSLSLYSTWWWDPRGECPPYRWEWCLVIIWVVVCPPAWFSRMHTTYQPCIIYNRSVPSVCLSVCTICMSVCLSVCTICMYVCLSVPSVCLSVCLYHLYVCLRTSLVVHLFFIIFSIVLTSVLCTRSVPPPQPPHPPQILEQLGGGKGSTWYRYIVLWFRWKHKIFTICYWNFRQYFAFFLSYFPALKNISWEITYTMLCIILILPKFWKIQSLGPK